MRPINIVIKGINSYVKEQTVHFDKVAENKLFGIFGETGSGKTTILDCIVMAIYGSTERETMQNVINVNSTDAYIKFQFEIFYEGENKRYEIDRTYKKQKGGIIKSTATLTDLDNETMISDNLDTVNEMCQKIVGIGKSEFLKCIAIPQGEFDAFLSDSQANRKKTISKLFNLEHFGAPLLEKLKKRKDLYTNKKISTEEKLNLYSNISDFNLNMYELELLDKEKLKIDVEFKLNSEKTKNILLINEYENIAKLATTKVQLSELLTNKDTIDYNRKQIEYTNAYGNYLAVNDKHLAIEKEIKAKEADIVNIKNQIADTEDYIKAEKHILDTLNIDKKVLTNKLVEYKSKMGEVASLSKTLANLETTINDLADKGNDCDKEVETINEKLREKKNNIDAIYLDLDEYNNIFKHYDKIVNKLNNTATLDLRRSLITKLDKALKYINSDDIADIPSTKTAMAINKMVGEIENLKKEQNQAVEDIITSLDVEFSGQNIASIKHDAEGKRNEVLESINNCNLEIQKISMEIRNLNDSIATVKNKKADIVKEYNKNVSEYNKAKEALTKLPSEHDVANVETELKAKESDVKTQDASVLELVNLKNKMITDIKVKNAEIDNLHNTDKQILDVLKVFDLNKMQEEISKDRMLLLKSVDEIERLKDNVAEYDNNYAYLTTLIRDLNTKIQDSTITKEDIEKSESGIADIEKELQGILTEIADIKSNIKLQVDHLQQVRDLKEEYKDILKNLDTIQKLQNMIDGGALMEYIAEEYMYLITDYANKYVYSISKGKYLLKYDKDFYVLDNFNGGIARTVKTLSGGERFIVSLSLALGISQSIAINNNASFNFFFIDEGFGSLSESYIDKILQSFDSLIKLNFTVGFITHVEKMKNYITNRVVVSKENNDQGSVVKEEY